MSWLTEQDRQNYGSELLDVAQRSALHALSPELQDIRNQNEALRQQLAREARRGLDAAVERALPNYRETDRDPRWHNFLLQIDPYTGQVRQQLLNAAIADGSASRVIAIFKGFMQSVGDQSPGSAATTSGRPRSSSSGNKPVYTRDQIALLYRQHQQGAYVGREAEWQRLEYELIAAGREGRISGALDWSGK